LRLLAQAYAENGDPSLKRIARQAAAYIIKRQQADGSWYYSESSKWIDNYHTGYILDCLDEYMKCTGDVSIKMQLIKGFKFYKDHFFTFEDIPKLYSNKVFPVDCTAAGQSLLTLLRFGEFETADRLAHWMIDHMQSSKGYFYYRKGLFFTTKTSFMRWSNAWMAASLSQRLIYSNREIT
jgi:hypothetical protein